MTDFWSIHQAAIHRGFNGARVGERFHVLLQEPLGFPLPPGGKIPDDTATVLSFYRTANDRCEPVDAWTRDQIADWPERHRETPATAWSFPL